MTDRRKAAKKAAKTRAANRAMLKHWREVDEPARRRLERLLNALLPRVETVKLRWNPLRDTSRHLKHYVQYGELIKFVCGGRTILVLPEGYKRPQMYDFSFWEPLVDRLEVKASGRKV